ncbi:hypothetical protein [Halobaculum lipolyticum]|uniref:Roadblock/LC7 domain-containing protein n=1 Tax=Halobaculum lipolyticum TaxID=3032001 RepID=A0ABD5WHM7_9EURY|nr:hypothetical protein [Halobaculum sp. DT31]
MSSPQPPQLLADEVVVTDDRDGRPLVVAGPPAALDAGASGLGDAIVGDGGTASTFFRGFTRTELDGPPAAWDLNFDRELWGPRDGWVSFTTDQTFLGGTDDPADVLAELRIVAGQLSELEAVMR